MRHSLRIGTIGLAFAVAAGAAPAAADSLEEIIRAGEVTLDVRYRYENVDQEGFDRDANAHTVRTRLGYRTGTYKGVSLYLEGENVAIISEKFNSTLNGKGQFPVVADPKATEVNQAYLDFTGVADTTFRGGRQVITLDNHRFVGHVGFRQNQQTFDGIKLVNTSLPDTEVFYGWIGNVNRIFGDDSPVGDFDSNTHLIHVANSSLPVGTITGYGYIVDLEDAPALSSSTFGVRLTGARTVGESGFKILYTGEYARQSDHAGNPAEFGLDYFRVEGGFGYQGLTATGGFEVLSGNGQNAVTTPLATLHAHNGWADVFLATPPQGLEDAFISLRYRVSGAQWLNGLDIWGVYHDFSSDFGAVDFGEEWDFRISKKFKKHFTATVKYADYGGADFTPSRQKFWLMLNFKL